MRPPLLVIVGPTAAGKSDLAVDLARELDAEVVSADSMQVYRHFDVGTGKLAPEEQRGVPHHLIDVVNPDEHFSAARFVELADLAIGEVASRGRQVVIAGGTGLYVRALLQGLFEAPQPSEEIREQHRRLRDELGTVAMHEQLADLDPEAASRINPNDFIRISRALEVYEQLGRPISELHRSHRFAERRYPSVMIGLAPPRQQLRERIEKRVDQMMARGWLDEVRHLVEIGYGASHPMGALGYRHLLQHLNRSLDLGEAVRQTKRDTWRFAKRQLNWFGTEHGICWFESREAVEPAELHRRLSEVRRERPDSVDDDEE
jgi:tRNA dimethylallyltransferase